MWFVLACDTFDRVQGRVRARPRRRTKLAASDRGKAAEVGSRRCRKVSLWLTRIMARHCTRSAPLRPAALKGHTNAVIVLDHGCHRCARQPGRWKGSSHIVLGLRPGPLLGRR